jgi:phospholipase/carboxylesterase
MVSSDPHRDQPVRTRGRPLETARGAMILVHGRGASAADILGLADELWDDDLAYLAPEASGGAWYPYSFLAPLARNEPWLTSALKALGRVVAQASAAGIPASRVILVGFSQGACLATEFAARHATRYGGLVAFTGGLIGPPETTFAYPGDLAGTPVFLGAGDPDPHVPWARVEETALVLSRLGGQVTLRRYPGMPHTINRDEIDEARKIVAQVKGPRDA